MSGDYIVIYEDDSTEDIPDEIVLDVRRLRKALLTQVDIETGVDLYIDNTSSRVGLVGLLVSIVGAVTGLVATYLFASTYPGDWFDGGAVAGQGIRQWTAILAVASGLLLVAGTALTAYGRRVTAFGQLRGFHLVKRTPHAKTDLR